MGKTGVAGGVLVFIAGLAIFLDDLHSLLDFDNKTSKLRKLWWDFQGVPIEDYNKLKEAFKEIKDKKESNLEKMKLEDSER